MVIGHRLGRNDRHDVDVLGEAARRLGGDERGTRARLARDVDQRLRCRQIARPGGNDEEIAGAERRRRHVAPDCDVPAHVKEPHGEAAHLQALASEPEDDDALRRDDGVDEPVERVPRHGGEDAPKLVQRAFRQLGQAFGHGIYSDDPLFQRERGSFHTDPRLTMGHSTLICRGRLVEPEAASSRISAAIEPISKCGKSTVVSGGCRCWAISRSS